MKAVFVRRTGEPEVLELEELSLPSPKRGEARIRIEAAGVNFIDVYYRRGIYPSPLPLVLGAEGAGVIEEVGPEADLAPGTRVSWVQIGSGSYATHANISCQALVPIPDRIDSRTAAAAMLQGITAHYLSRSTAPLAKGRSCLVLAAAGGVGGLLCQAASSLGAQVIGCVSSDAKEKVARESGAQQIIRYDRAPFAAEVRRLTGGRGVDVVFDSVGKATFEQSLESLAPRGMLVLYGLSSGPVEPFDLQRLTTHGSLSIMRPSLVDFTATRQELLSRANDLFDWIAQRKLTIRIDRVLPLDRAAEAHRALESRATSGKVLLIP